MHGGAQRVTLNLFSEADSVELLRTTTAPYRTGDGDGDVAKLAQLCARLPLALRIAAERAAARPRMTLNALIRDLLDESSLWMALTEDEAEQEVDAVRSVFAWSYRALPEPTARLFRLLGVFPGADFSTRAAAVLTGMSEPTANRLLGDLVDAHLIEQTGEDLYQFHDLLRAYAGDLAVQIDPPADVEAALAALLEWYLRCSAELAALNPFSLGHRQVELAPPIPNAAKPGFADYEQAVAWFHSERADITSVIEAAARVGPNAAVWQIPALLRQIFDRERAFDDWLATAELGLAAARALGSDDGQLLLLGSLGRGNFSLNHLGEADRYYSALLDRCREMGHSHDEAVAENVMGVLEIKRHRCEQALAHIDRCDELCREHGFRELTVNPATNRAQALLAFGGPAKALAMAEQAVESTGAWAASRPRCTRCSTCQRHRSRSGHRQRLSVALRSRRDSPRRAAAAPKRVWCCSTWVESKSRPAMRLRHLTLTRKPRRSPARTEKDSARRWPCSGLDGRAGNWHGLTRPRTSTDLCCSPGDR